MRGKIIFVILITAVFMAGCGKEAGSEVPSQTTDEEGKAGISAEVAAEGTGKPDTDSKAGEASEAEEDHGETTDTVEQTKVMESAENQREAMKPAKETESTREPEKPEEAAETEATAVPAVTQPVAAAGGQSGDSGSQTANNQSPANPVQSAHTHTWDGGSVTTAPACTSEGIRTYTCTDCGKTKTESIPKTSHDYVTETKAATCTEAGSTKTYCSICGNVQSEISGDSAIGHNYEKKYWPNKPSCTTSGYYNLVCVNCGTNGGDGTDPALEHSWDGGIVTEATCTSPGSIYYTCIVCGAPKREEIPITSHTWVEASYEEFNLETLEWETKTGTHCSQCGTWQ